MVTTSFYTIVEKLDGTIPHFYHKDMGPTKRKILLLLMAGIALGLAYTPKRQRRILQEVGKEWKKIDEEKLKRDVGDLYRSKFVGVKENPDGSCSYVLTETGEQRALAYRIKEMKVSKQPWDGKWRIVIFDIPEKVRRARDALRKKLRDFGFYELQKSAFILPYECKNEIGLLVEFWGIRKYVRYGVLETIDNEPHLKSYFKLGE